MLTSTKEKKTNGPAWIDFIFYFNHAFGSSKNCHNYKTQYNGGNRVGKNKQPNAVYEYLSLSLSCQN